MRAYEQIRINLALSSQCRDINVNLIGVGAGISYDMSGPSHHCLEDISVIRTLPNILLCSPADWVTAEKFVAFSISTKKPKYIRLDGKALPQIYPQEANFDWQTGFSQLVKGDDICFVSTGWMTHKALRIAEKFREVNRTIGVIDTFMLRPFNEGLFFETVKGYKTIVTLEEAFIGKGGLDSLVSNILRDKNSNIRLKRAGFDDKYVFESGNREFLSELGGFSEKDLMGIIENIPAV
jgi:transketolase